MGKRPELTYVVNVIMGDESIVPFDNLTEEQHRLWEENTCARLSENMSDYYTQHPDSYKSLIVYDLEAENEERKFATTHGGR